MWDVTVKLEKCYSMEMCTHCLPFGGGDTGKKDKKDMFHEFGNGLFPVVSYNMDLRLGQNWTPIWTVIHMGCGEPSAIFQMISQWGWDGKPELAIMFVEKNHINWKNSEAQFKSDD